MSGLVSFQGARSAAGAGASGKGSSVPANDPAAFLGRFAPARSTARFSGFQLGFSFRSNAGVSSDRGYAQLGPERNGVFLR